MFDLLESLPVSPVLQKLIGSGAIIIITLLAAYIVRFLITAVALRIAARTRTSLDDRLLDGTKRQLFLLVFLLGISFLFDYLQIVLAESVGARLFEIIDGIIYAAGVVLVASILVRVISAILMWYGATIAVRTATQVDDEFIPLLDRAVKVIVYVLAILIILDHFSIDIKGLITVLGVGSLAVALAAQETIANMIGGFVIMIDRPFRIGDWLRLPDDTICRVHQIGVRSTKFLTLENTLIIVPNAELMKSTVHNITYPHPEVRVQINVGVSYGSDIELVKRVMLEEARLHPLVLDEPEPFFRFEEFADSSLNVSVFCRVPNVLDHYKAGGEIRERILNRFRKEGIEIPFPQRVVTMAPKKDKDRTNE
ncbi:MAG: mechanosensitive ion channel [Candidatus Zixiibacteriota bacterium]|nr:MAG: mechanosensitive ion channel [candidate division Zixibacteria bacterium]